MRVPSRSFAAGVLSGMVVFASGLALGGAMQDTPAVLRARQFEVVDEVGTVRAVIGQNDEGGSISVRDRFGRTVILAGAAEHGGTIVATHAESRRPAFVAGATSDGGVVTVWSERGEPMGRLEAPRAGGRLHLAGPGGLEVNPTLRLETADGGAGSITGLAPGKGPIFRLFAGTSQAGVVETYQSGQPLVTMSSTVAGHGQIRTRSADGQPMILLTATPENDAQIYTYGAGHPLFALATRPEGPTLRLFNRAGDAVVTMEAHEDGGGEVAVMDAEGTGRSVRP